MSRAKRMQYIAGLAERRAREAAQRLGEAQQTVFLHEAQLSELEDYRFEYTRKSTTPGGPAVAARDLQNRQRFITRLDAAMIEQQHTIQRVRQSLEEKRQRWLACRARTQALEKLAARYRFSEQRIAARREQAEMDDGYRSPVFRQGD